MLDYLKKTWPEVTFQTHATRRWATNTFSGPRHTITCTMPNTSDFLVQLPDHEFPTDVVDAQVVYTNTDVVGGYTQATIEILELSK
jgi:hypothetical protein